MTSASPLRARLGIVVLLAATSGCRSVSALKQRCLTGDTSACESACKKGVPGEGGCFHAGEQLRTRAALDFKNDDFRRARDFFRRSCDGRYADGCVLSAQMLEAPYGVPDPASGEATPPTMPDADMLEREKRLGAACSLGAPTGCKRLGDVLIGKSDERALPAYEKACATSADVAGCRAARAREVQTAGQWRLACTHGAADDCTRLGNLLYAVDPPRAVRLFVSECELRGVAELFGGVGGFVRERMRGASAGIPLRENGPRPTRLVDGGVSVVVLPSRVTGQVAMVEVDRALRQRQDELSACLASDAKEPGEIALGLTVDRTGDVFRSVVSRSTLPSPSTACVKDVIDSLAFTAPPAGLATVDVTLRFGGT